MTDQKTMKAELESPLILIYDKKISSIQAVVPVLEKVLQVRAADSLRSRRDGNGELLRPKEDSPCYCSALFSTEAKPVSPTFASLKRGVR